MTLSPGPLEYYLLAVNVLGFILGYVRTLVYRYATRRRMNTALCVVSLLGGALGVVLCSLLFDRKPGKDSMTPRVVSICILVIYTVIYLLFSFLHEGTITFAFWRFFAAHPLFLLYWILINIVTFFLFGADKLRAIRRRSRIRIVTLLALAFAGGAPGGLIAMHVFRHKTRQDYFSIGLPLIILMQAVVLFFLMNL